MDVRIDAIGNVVGRYEGETPGRPCLMLGSHLDTVRDAGRYDGMLGVVTAIECVGDLHARGRRLPFAVEVVGFADEEGVRFSVDAARAAARSPARSIAALLDKRGRRGIDDARRARRVRARSRAHRRGRAQARGCARLRGAAHRAGPGARSARTAGRRGHRDQWRQSLRSTSPVWPAMPGRCRWACAATRSPPLPNACSQSSGSRRACRTSSAPSAASKRIPARQRDSRQGAVFARRARPDATTRAMPPWPRCARSSTRSPRAAASRSRSRRCGMRARRRARPSCSSSSPPRSRRRASPFITCRRAPVMTAWRSRRSRRSACCSSVAQAASATIPPRRSLLADVGIGARVLLRFIEHFAPSR